MNSTLRFILVVLTAAISLAGPGSAQVVVRMQTNFGDIDVQLYDRAAPGTVGNFLNYVDKGSYENSFFHRSVPNFVIQGGGFYVGDGQLKSVQTDPPIANEFAKTRSNLRGTIAMAKLGGDPDSATSQWFFNLGDNSANLDNQNGGFTVFGKVIRGMDHVDAIAALKTLPCASPFNEVPVRSDKVTCETALNELVYLSNVREILNIQGRVAELESFAGDAIRITARKPAAWSGLVARDNPAKKRSPGKVAFEQGFFRLGLRRLKAGAATAIDLQLPAGFVPNAWYAYGPTADRPTAHWYRFDYDGRTGAEYVGGNRMTVHFVDGLRGDGDLKRNGRISHTGAPAVDPHANTLPVVIIKASDRLATEAKRTPGVFTLERSGNLAGSLTVAYRVLGDATNGSDYRLLSGRVTFQPGRRKVQVRIKPTQDRLKEPLENVTLRLQSRRRYRIGYQARATVKLRSDE